MRRVKVAGLCLELSDAQVDELREQLSIEGVSPNGDTERPALDVKGMAAQIGRSVDFVYDHAEELGGRKVGGVWLFDVDRLHRGDGGGAVSDMPDMSKAGGRRRRPRQRGSSSLAVRGSKPL